MSASGPGRDQVLQALSRVQDPELKRDLVSLGMIEDVAVDGAGNVSVKVRLTTPACPLKAIIRKDVEAAVRGVPGVASVAVDMDGAHVASARAGGHAGARAGEERLPAVRNIVAVGSGKGGVGKSTVAVNLALALARSGARVGLMDADLYGPSIPIMLGLADARAETTTVDGRELLRPMEAHGLRVFSIGFLVKPEDAVIWRGPMLHKAIQQFLDDVHWGELDYLVVDLPPGTGDVQLSLTQLVPVTAAVVVTTPQDVAFADVLRAVKMFGVTKTPVLGVVENMAGFVCPSCGAEHALFGKGRIERLATAAGVPYLGALPVDADVSPQSDAGVPILAARPYGPAATALSRVASSVASAIGVMSCSTPQA